MKETQQQTIKVRREYKPGIDFYRHFEQYHADDNINLRVVPKTKTETKCFVPCLLTKDYDKTFTN